MDPAQRMAPADRIVDQARTKLGLSDADIAECLDVTQRTVRRWRAGAATPTAGNQRSLTKLHRLTGLLITVLPDREAIRQWCDSPAPASGGSTPYALIRSRRLDELIEALANHHTGAFV